MSRLTNVMRPTLVIIVVESAQVFGLDTTFTKDGHAIFLWNNWQKERNGEEMGLQKHVDQW